MSWSGPQDGQGWSGGPVPPPPQGAWPQQAPQVPQPSPYAGWQAPQPWGPPPPSRPALLPAALPLADQSYAQVLRPLPKRVGRWFLAWAVALGFFITGQLVQLAILMPAMLDVVLRLAPTGAADEQAVTDALFEVIGTPAGMLAVNLSWAAMIPGAIVALAAFGKGAAGYASSVVGRWRWGAVGRSAITIVPIFALYIGFSLSMDPSLEWRWDPNWALVAIVLLTTPLQATGEEFAFRGFLTQMLGSWLPNRWVAALVTGAGIGLLFGAAHGHTAISATLQLALVGFACSMLTFRTGGLEAASVLHTANNVFIMVPLALTGTSAFSSPQPVAGEDWLSLGLAALALGLAYLAVHLTMPKAQRLTTGAPGAELLLPQPRLAPPVAMTTS